MLSRIRLQVSRITENGVAYAISRLKNKLASGSDQITSCVVQDSHNVFLKLFCTILNLSLCSYKFSDVRRIVRLCPVLKGGDTANVCNYGPIAIYYTILLRSSIAFCIYLLTLM